MAGIRKFVAAMILGIVGLAGTVASAGVAHAGRTADGTIISGDMECFPFKGADGKIHMICIPLD